jgi:hypothetical protein
LERKGFGKKTILTRMGVVFSMLKDHTKEKGNGPAESAVD